jgi:hypothetical protein
MAVRRARDRNQSGQVGEVDILDLFAIRGGAALTTSFDTARGSPDRAAHPVNPSGGVNRASSCHDALITVL